MNIALSRASTELMLCRGKKLNGAGWGFQVHNTAKEIFNIDHSFFVIFR